jgi:hypothetical protein
MTDEIKPVEDNGAAPAAETVIPENSDANGGGKPDIESWKAENKVPYSRFEDVVRANQEFRDTKQDVATFRHPMAGELLLFSQMDILRDIQAFHLLNV